MLKKMTTIMVISSLFVSTAIFAETAGGPASTGAQKANQQITLAKAKININKASVTELETLSHVGVKLAQRIVDYRQQHGNFKTIADLTQVKGVSEKMLTKIKDQIMV